MRCRLVSFSSALRELGLSSHGLIMSLLASTPPSSSDMALVVAVAIPAPAFVRDRRRDRRIIWGSSVAIFVGTVLFLERAFF